MTREDPYEFLQKYIGKEIKVRLKNSEIYKGLLIDIERSNHDGVGNIKLQNVRNRYKQNFEWVLIRGNNILFIYL
jgi:small nuclear ribonucleoprotein (snRNP)-like protein